MSIAIPVFPKYRVGDHVGLPEIMAVGQVLDRRGVPVGSDQGAGRYLVEFDGVSGDVHLDLVVTFTCSCKAHEALLAKMRRRKFDRERDMPGAVAELGRNCESKYVPKQEKSRIWLKSSQLVNCTGKRRLPLGATGWSALTYFDLTPMGTWDPKSAPR
jgi:hypothetical protein